MGTWKITVPGRFPGLNDYVKACHSQHARKRMKAEGDGAVARAAMAANVPRLRAPVRVTVDCFERDRRRDKDNVHSMAVKFALDGLRACKVIGNDGWDWIDEAPGGSVGLDRTFPRVEITLEGDEA